MKPHHGFSLIELAIVLVIITVLIGGLAVPLTAQIQARRIAETNKTLEEAREAIIGYAMSNTTSSCTCKYQVDNTVTPPSTALDPDSSNPSACKVSLCPASPSLISTTAIATLTLQPRHYLPCPSNDGTGIESRCNNAAGCDGLSYGACIPCTDANHDNLDDVTGKRCNLLPWATLGVVDQDSWGNRLHYGVIGTYANANTGFSSSPQDFHSINAPNSCSGIFTGSGNNCTGSDVSNCYKQVCGLANTTITTIAENVPVVLISYGPNGWGAQSANEKILATPTGNDEKKNLDVNQFYVSRPPYQPKDGSAAEQAKEFDDLVVWISDGLLKSRVCPAGGCP